MSAQLRERTSDNRELQAEAREVMGKVAVTVKVSCLSIPSHSMVLFLLFLAMPPQLPYSLHTIPEVAVCLMTPSILLSPHPYYLHYLNLGGKKLLHSTS